jgi:hypothetical protein
MPKIGKKTYARHCPNGWRAIAISAYWQILNITREAEILSRDKSAKESGPHLPNRSINFD